MLLVLLPTPVLLPFGRLSREGEELQLPDVGGGRPTIGVPLLGGSLYSGYNRGTPLFWGENTHVSFIGFRARCTGPCGV